MKIQSSRFERAAVKAEDEPKMDVPRIVFLGRSNVGKSSLINRLLGVKGLAKTSSRPGRTQTVNFYRVNEAWQIVDLPGYGYAKVPEAVRRTWAPMVEGFLVRSKESIALGVIVVDARRPPTELDAVMRDWLESKEIPYIVTATKADKMSGNKRKVAERVVKDWPGKYGVAPGLLASAETGTGTREIWREFERALEKSFSKRGAGQREH
ncbi:MAG: ribosome biogenesis GTP-binding protein YihA/YsxC [Acidobacteriota bacterium]|nr:ribosome biogenesis GTP-binding protein YihA/YsxC [Acidobacteriota bacterium]MDH3786812.1 ribosome biogenesis GTP-binding protein YihA/YsxC [Acidobacteriota bacterium]